MKINRKYIGVVVVLMLIAVFAFKLWPDSGNMAQASFTGLCHIVWKAL